MLKDRQGIKELTRALRSRHTDYQEEQMYILDFTSCSFPLSYQVLD
jgi:hypothetical protein